MELREQAENSHEVWALQRVDEGWTYGKKRDDQQKHHPNLLPYSQLKEDEKDYVRNTAMETLKTVISLGYEIRRR
ncbi:Ryanodine receptor Ryr [Siminovitchia acidinfaciens]|uniref:Ryanodine receptor Ryr n=2 Tax=Siminovitchia acidinfaciens TaxID=2321395 RepID=A0A429Y788_9BACI|nr:RyR domain-containing protein [Siminovitchia acidinfaciens]RST77319.1 Ryanodine receptor Ryr [Siminovitchia acidinfaciens]